MTAYYKNKNLLKNQPFYSSEIKSVKKITKKFVILNFYLNYHSFLKNLKD